MRVGLSGAGRIGSLYAGVISGQPEVEAVFVGDVDIERPEHTQRFLECCGTGLCLDTGHSVVGGGDPVEVVESAAVRIRHVHLKDVDEGLAEGVASGALGYEETVRHGLYKPLGGGDADVRTASELLEEIGYKGWYVLEQDVMLEAEPDSGSGPYEDVRKSLACLLGVMP
jgi:inosose dehydratase